MNEVIEITPDAVMHLQKMLDQNPAAKGIRLGVKDSGCSGLSYTVDFANSIDAADQSIVVEGIMLIVDSDSLKYLKGMELDCTREGLNQHLKFNNPNAVNPCGCGESFQFKGDVEQKE